MMAAISTISIMAKLCPMSVDHVVFDGFGGDYPDGRSNSVGILPRKREVPQHACGGPRQLAQVIDAGAALAEDAVDFVEVDAGGGSDRFVLVGFDVAQPRLVQHMVDVVGVTEHDEPSS